MAERNGLSDLQFGFREEKSTVHAVEHVVKLGTSKSKVWEADLFIDIRNAKMEEDTGYIERPMYRTVLDKSQSRLLSKQIAYNR